MQLIETTRTNAGSALYQKLVQTMHYDQALDETRRRVEVRAERVGSAAAHVWTRLDQGAWMDEGVYTVAPMADVELPAEEDVPFDVDRAGDLAS
jgi:hypothetical protein